MNEKIAWLEENAEAEAEDLKAQKKEMEDIIQPIIAKLYQVRYRIFVMRSITITELFSLAYLNSHLSDYIDIL